MRILQEAKAMSRRGHRLLFAVAPGAELGKRAKEEGFTVYELSFSLALALLSLPKLIRILWKEGVHLVNTHSSADAWLGGAAARLARKKVIRTRHLSTPTRPGLNSKLLFRGLADATVTTCLEVATKLQKQAGLPLGRCRSIPTGIDPGAIQVKESSLASFCQRWGLEPEDCVVGTLCVFRSWKGLFDLLEAAALLSHQPHFKWLLVGGGPAEERLKKRCRELHLADRVIFTGFLDDPFPALAAMDLFVLLSKANEGVSQAALQAAYLKKPLIATRVGGLPEICISGKTGCLVEPGNPRQAAGKILKLATHQRLREKMGAQAHSLVMRRFTEKRMIGELEELYRRLRA